VSCGNTATHYSLTSTLQIKKATLCPRHTEVMNAEIRKRKPAMQDAQDATEKKQLRCNVIQEKP
jgi:hypothetical protein